MYDPSHIGNLLKHGTSCVIEIRRNNGVALADTFTLQEVDIRCIANNSPFQSIDDEHIFIPIYDEIAVHWTVIYFNYEKNIIIHYDSLEAEARYKYQREMVFKYLSFLQKLWEIKDVMERPSFVEQVLEKIKVYTREGMYTWKLRREEYASISYYKNWERNNNCELSEADQKRYGIYNNSVSVQSQRDTVSCGFFISMYAISIINNIPLQFHTRLGLNSNRNVYPQLAAFRKYMMSACISLIDEVTVRSFTNNREGRSTTFYSNLETTTPVPNNDSSTQNNNNEDDFRDDIYDNMYRRSPSSNSFVNDSIEKDREDSINDDTYSLSSSQIDYNSYVYAAREGGDENNSTCLQQRTNYCYHDELGQRSRENYPSEVHSSPYRSQTCNVVEETYDTFGIERESSFGDSSFYNNHDEDSNKENYGSQQNSLSSLTLSTSQSRNIYKSSERYDKSFQLNAQNASTAKHKSSNRRYINNGNSSGSYQDIYNPIHPFVDSNGGHQSYSAFRRPSMNHATGADNSISNFSLSNHDNRRLPNADFRRHSFNNGIRPQPNNAYTSQSNVSYGYPSNSISKASYAINSMERIHFRNPTDTDTNVNGKRGRPHARSQRLTNINPFSRSSMTSKHGDDVPRPPLKRQQSKKNTLPFHRQKK